MIAGTDAFDKNYAEILADPMYPNVAKKAETKGYRLATAREVRASLNCDWHAPDLYCAYGVNWVKVGDSETATPNVELEGRGAGFSAERPARSDCWVTFNATSAVGKTEPRPAGLHEKLQALSQDALNARRRGRRDHGFMSPNS